jgi:peptidoglycan/LPS O-acetylase OafA/YrhL
VEEHFYFLLSLVVLVLIRASKANSFKRLPSIIAVVAATCLLLRIQRDSNSFDFLRHWTPSHLRIDSLCFGVLLSHWYHFRREHFTEFATRYKAALLLLGAALLSPAFFLPYGQSRFLTTFGFTTIYIGAGLILVGALGSEKSAQQNRVTNCLAMIGIYSYSIYLWHTVAPPFLWDVLDSYFKIEFRLGSVYWWVYFPFYFLSAIAVGTILSKLAEWPLLRLRDRLFPTRSTFFVKSNDNVLEAARAPELVR